MDYLIKLSFFPHISAPGVDLHLLRMSLWVVILICMTVNTVIPHRKKKSNISIQLPVG